MTSTTVPFHDAEGNPLQELHIKVEVDKAAGFVGLVLSMKAAAEAHAGKYGTGIDTNTIRTLEALAETVEIALDLTDDEVPIDMFEDVIRFHQHFDLEYKGKPRSLRGVKDDVGQDLFDFRIGFDREETDEYDDEQERLSLAVESNDEDEVTERLHKQLDALLDGVYVKLGTAYMQFGRRPVREGWKRVQKANMAKERATDVSQSKRGSLFDVVKPIGWVEPDHRDLVADHEHRIYRHPGKLNAGHEHDTMIVPPSSAVKE